MSNSEKPEDLILRIVKQFVIAAYTLFILLATGFIVVGKFVFDALHIWLERNKERQPQRKFVESSTSNENP